MDPPAEVLNKLSGVLTAVAVTPTRRALVVDDDRFFRQVLGNTLRLGRFDILESGNGLHAFDLLLDELMRVDVLVADLYMPGLTGAELIQKIRGVGGETSLAIVVVTGTNLDDAERARIMALGADAVLTKDTNPEEILLRIEAVLGAKPSDDPLE